MYNEEQNSSHCQACTSCQWQSEQRSQWCRMFRSRPTRLPCAQHDAFAGEREAMGMLIQKCPVALTAFTAGVTGLARRAEDTRFNRAPFNQEPQTKE